MRNENYLVTLWVQSLCDLSYGEQEALPMEGIPPGLRTSHLLDIDAELNLIPLVVVQGYYWVETM